MKLSDKQKEVIKEMRSGYILHWVGGLKPTCFLSGQYGFKLSTTTCLKLESLGIIKRLHNDGNTKFHLTKPGKTIEL